MTLLLPLILLRRMLNEFQGGNRMRLQGISLFAALLLAHSTSFASYRIGKIVTPNSEKIIFATPAQPGFTSGQTRQLQSLPCFVLFVFSPTEKGLVVFVFFKY
jgi:hypothetical protein